MNKSIFRLFACFVVLFALLIVFTSRWTVFEAQSLRDNPDNRRALIEQSKIKRGDIKGTDGQTLARSVPAGAGTYTRRYPLAGLFAHAVGYAFTSLGRAGTEQYRNSALVGQRDELTQIIDDLTGRKQQGDSVRTTLDANAQQVAYDQLAGRKGAVVALEPKTGRVRVMTSEPTYNPNNLDESISKLNRDPNSPLLNRTTQAGYPPGSTFKVVTATAAIDSGEFDPDSVLDGSSPQDFSGVPLSNDSGQSFGDISLTQALTFSVNTVWGQVGEKLGKGTLAEYMERYGFFEDPQLDYPSGQMIASGEYNDRGRLLPPDSSQIDVARMAIGQDKLRVTPLQMAEVAAAVANDGVLMKPRLAERIVDKTGRVVDEVQPSEQDRVMKSSTSDQLTEMMANVVREGTGVAAALEGIQVAGKTGTAEVDNATMNQPWFIGFAPAKDPQIAVAVTVERSTGEGGTVAAPIAAKVIESLLKP